jgi:hypothetical protein
MNTSRRSFLGLLAAPAIVRVGSIMPVRALPPRSYLQSVIDEYGEPLPVIPPMLTTYSDPRVYIDPRVYKVLFEGIWYR